MTGRSHLIIGLSTGLLVSTLVDLNIGKTIVFTAATGLGALLPDIDCPNSTISKRLPLISAFFTSITTHRSITHTPFFWSILLIGWLALAPPYTILAMGLFGIFLGGISHIFADALTVSGVPFLYPFSKKKLSLLPIKTNSGGEYLFTVLFCSATMYISYINWGI